MSLSEHVGRSQKLDCINPFLGVMVITGMKKIQIGFLNSLYWMTMIQIRPVIYLGKL